MSWPPCKWSTKDGLKWSCTCCGRMWEESKMVYLTLSKSSTSERDIKSWNVHLKHWGLLQVAFVWISWHEAMSIQKLMCHVCISSHTHTHVIRFLNSSLINDTKCLNPKSVFKCAYKEDMVCQSACLSVIRFLCFLITHNTSPEVLRQGHGHGHIF